ncbi:MAG: ComEA family DNA-binding protein [Planctomycetota bacterium]|nr:MAG: ComEA family DNA-binding protein [Planctomycetota bacterium]
MPAPIDATATTIARSTRVIACLAILAVASLGLARSVLPASAPAAVGTIRVDLNAASAAELDLLPHIGPALAARIVEDRAANGPYSSVDDLQRVSGIGPKTVERLRPVAEVSAKSVSWNAEE